jgi:hypothetical protein
MISGRWSGAEATSGTGAGQAGRQCAGGWLVLADWLVADWLVLAGWLVLAALAGTVEAKNHPEQAAASTAQATALRRRPGRGVSHSRVAPAR